MDIGLSAAFRVVRMGSLVVCRVRVRQHYTSTATPQWRGPSCLPAIDGVSGVCALCIVCACVVAVVVIRWFDPQMLVIRAEPYASAATVLFQRLTVIIADVALYAAIR